MVEPPPSVAGEATERLTVTREQRLAATFVDLADSLVVDFDVVDLMVLLAERCVEMLDVAAAGLLLDDGTGSLCLIAATDEALEMVELFQIQADEGPCRDCFHTGSPVSTSDIAEESARWPRFAPIAAAAGYRAIHAVPLRLRGQVLGALNLFGTEPAALSRADLATGQAFADVATIALLQSRAVNDSRLIAEQLQQALQSRIVVEQAKGILAQALGLPMDEAFSGLRRYARGRGRRLADIAREVVDGTISPDAMRGPSMR